jgi:ABC-type multidrug transport system ATPase subunit
MHDPQNPAPAVEIRDLTVGYQRGAPVFENLSASFDPGGLVRIAGNNGSGKSTLLEVCSGYLPPWQGSVLINGVDASSAAARTARRVCRTKQALYPNMTVRDHLAFAARSVRVDLDGVLDRAERYGLHRWFAHDAKSLSTGNSRKLWIVACTVGDFDVVLLDEPFNGVDDEGAEVLRREIDEWSVGKTVFLIAHKLPGGLRADRTYAVDQTAAPSPLPVA